MSINEFDGMTINGGNIYITDLKQFNLQFLRMESCSFDIRLFQFKQFKTIKMFGLQDCGIKDATPLQFCTGL